MVATVMIVLIPHPFPGRKKRRIIRIDVIVFLANCLLVAGKADVSPRYQLAIQFAFTGYGIPGRLGSAMPAPTVGDPSPTRGVSQTAAMSAVRGMRAR
jgi:hypothetical protein